jgi:antitoxin component YwqK of YwqJK toxin-antitoxin module
MINVIKNTNLPIYAWNRCWSKTKHKNLPKTSQLPLQDLDVINIDFLTEVNECIQKENTQILKCINTNGNDLINANIKPNEITFECFFNNGQIKHSTTCLNGKFNGISKKWHPSGQIKEIIEYYDNTQISRKTYYESGNQEIFEIQNDEGISSFLIKHFYENGQIRFENDNQGNTFSYFPDGKISSQSIMHEDIRNGGHVLIFEFSENGNKIKETKNYYTDGLLHGYEKSFFDTGEIRREVDYTNGYNKKIIKTYKKNGEVSIK